MALQMDALEDAGYRRISQQQVSDTNNKFMNFTICKYSCGKGLFSSYKRSIGWSGYSDETTSQFVEPYQ